MAFKLPFISREAYEVLAAEKQALADRLRGYQDQNDYLRTSLDDARADATRGREMVADWLAQRVFGTPIYGVAPALPEADDASEAALAAATRPKASARAMAKQMTEKFFEEFEARSAGHRNKELPS